MQDLLSQLNTLRRPRLLIRTARIAASDFRREARLPRLLGYGAPQKSGAILMRLMAMEGEMNDKRVSGDAGYRVVDHVEVLTAIMSEAELLRAQTRAVHAV